MAALCAAPAVAAAEPTGDVTRSFNQRLITKVRPGTYLAGPDGLPVPPVPRLQAPGEAKMVAEAARHFARIGQLDAIGEVLQAGHDPAHIERIEEVYRRERQRFFAAMRRMMLARRAAWLGEAP